MPPSLRDTIRAAALGAPSSEPGAPPVVRALADAIRQGHGAEYTQPGALSRLRHEAATGRGRPRSLQDWRMLQRGLQDHRDCDEGARTKPFEKRAEHDPADVSALPGSDRHVIHDYNRRMNQAVEDQQVAEALQAQMGTDATRAERAPTRREQLEAAYSIHS